MITQIWKSLVESTIVFPIGAPAKCLALGKSISSLSLDLHICTAGMRSLPLGGHGV